MARGYAPTSRVDWKAAVWAGVIAGVIFILLEMIMVPAFLGDSPWAPIRMMAAIVLGQGVLPPPATFDAGIFVTAMIVHFALSIVYGLIVGRLVFRWSLGPALAAGGAFGLALYLVNFYLFTAIFPWFAMARNWVSIFAHISFGVAAAWSYKGLEHRGARPGEAEAGVEKAAD